ncbi:ABC-three component system protein [Modestobacter italicus]|uniref:ABC-three component system protein n=1 Tax=Modestobacter italicus (strain DSM 44449 / CECT 9708 / BC 501) TaxID=2732864 RepID=UPI001C940E13|nr:ABC-three component system protein [Modestobacter italicus]
MPSETHSAAASASGYLYQTSWALLELLRQAPHRPDQAISVEMHDDIAWEDTSGSATELLQAKLHRRATAGLGDKDTDIWKTLGNWMARADATDPSGADLALVTTSVAQSGTAAYLLRPDPATRDVPRASRLLQQAAEGSTSKSTETARVTFLDLSPAARENLLAKVRVLDGATQPQDIDAAVRRALTLVLPQGEQAQSRFVAEVRRWWDRVAVDMLAGRRSALEVGQLQAFLQDLRNGFGPDSLWTTIEREDIPEEPITRADDARFVDQMRLVSYPQDNLRRAVIDYYRAIAQETQWLDDSLLELNELSRFEANLRDEWARAFSDMLDDVTGGVGEYDPSTIDEATKVRAGKVLLRQLLDSTSVTIRRHYDDPFFARGKRHELANRSGHVGIGWHPDFASRLQAVVATA